MIFLIFPSSVLCESIGNSVQYFVDDGDDNSAVKKNHNLKCTLTQKTKSILNYVHKQQIKIKLLHV